MQGVSLVYKRLMSIAASNSAELENWLGMDSGSYEKILFDICGETTVRVYVSAKTHVKFAKIISEIEGELKSIGFCISESNARKYRKYARAWCKRGEMQFDKC